MKVWVCGVQSVQTLAVKRQHVQVKLSWYKQSLLRMHKEHIEAESVCLHVMQLI